MGGFGQYFLSIFLIGSGIILIIKQLFRLNISTSRAIVGVLIISIGAAMILADFSIKNDKTLIFSNDEIQVSQLKNKYNIIFSEGTIDLTRLDSNTYKGKVEINTIFASGTLYIPSDLPVIIEINAAFAKAETPDGHSVVFGDYTYQNREPAEGEVPLRIEVNTVFGKMDIIES